MMKKYEQEFSPTVGYGEGIGIAFDADETDSDSIVEVALYDKANELIGEWSISKQEFSGYNSFYACSCRFGKKGRSMFWN